MIDLSHAVLKNCGQALNLETMVNRKATSISKPGKSNK